MGRSNTRAVTAIETLSNILFGNKPGPDRKFYLDYLRVLATVFVISGHTVSLAASLVPQYTNVWYVLETLFFVFPASNLLFIMISGALLLNVKNESAGTFYRKRFLRVIIPMIIYYILYVVAKEGIAWIMPDHWLPLIRRIASGPPEEAPHFWLIYTILWLYILTPIIRYIVQHISERVLKILLWIVLLINSCYTFIPIFNQNKILGIIVSSFAGVFIFGYFLSKKRSRILEIIIILFGILSIPVASWFIHSTEEYGAYIYNNSPIMLALAMAFFIIVKESEAFFASKKSRTIQKTTNHHHLFSRMVGKYSFSILMLHWGVLHFLVKQYFGISVLSGAIWGGCIVTIILTFVFSLIGAIILDNTIIHFFEVIISKFLNMIFNRRTQK